MKLNERTDINLSFTWFDLKPHVLAPLSSHTSTYYIYERQRSVNWEVLSDGGSKWVQSWGKLELLFWLSQSRYVEISGSCWGFCLMNSVCRRCCGNVWICCGISRNSCWCLYLETAFNLLEQITKKDDSGALGKRSYIFGRANLCRNHSSNSLSCSADRLFYAFQYGGLFSWY